MGYARDVDNGAGITRFLFSEELEREREENRREIEKERLEEEKKKEEEEGEKEEEVEDILQELLKLDEIIQQHRHI